MYLHTPALEVGSWWRVDTASGTNTATTVYAHDGTDAIPTSLGTSGSTVRGNTRDGTAVFWSAAATLYCKELTYQGVPTGTVVTSTGATPAAPGTTAPVDIATISTLVAALPTTYVKLLVTDATSTTLTGTLVAGHLSPVDCTAGPGARTLPAASSVAAGTPTVAKKADTTANALVVSRAGSDLIFGTGSGATSKTLIYPGEAATFVSNGVNGWSIESSDTPSGVLTTTFAPIAATPVTSTATSGTLTAGAEHALSPASAAAWTLPTGVTATKLPTTVKNNGTAAVTVARGGSDTINGGTASVSIAAGEWARFTSNGSGAWTQSGTAGESGTYAALTPYGRTLRPGRGMAVVMGDSITAQDGDGNTLRCRDSWFQSLCGRTSQRIRYGAVYATTGYKLSDMRTNFLPSILATSPKPAACMILGGTNSETSGLVSDGLAVLKDMCTQLVTAGIVPILICLLPKGDGTNSYQQQFNNALRQFSAKYGFPLLDMSPALLTSAGARDSSLYSDVTHPTRTGGHTAMATRAAASGLDLQFPPIQRLTAKESGDAYNLIPSGFGLFAVDSNADGLADGWSAAGTNVTYSLVNSAGSDDISGKWQRVVRTTGGATSTVFQRTVSTGFTVGNRIAYSGRFRATVAGTASTYTFQIAFTGSGAHSLEPIFNWEQDVTGAFYGEAVIPTGTTALQVQCTLSVPTSGSPQLDVAELTVWDLTAAESLLP